jgi:uncharacterized membrane protein YbhN (UPF0104 family)
LRKLHKRPERLSWIWVKRGLLVAFLAALTWLMVQQARHIAWSEVMASVRAYSWATLLACSALAVTSLTLYSCYDLLGRRYTGHHLPTLRVMLVNFVSYVFNLNLGALIGGVAFRLRLYTRLGLNTGQITRIYSLSLVTNWLGYFLLAGSLFALYPLPLPPNWPIHRAGLQLLGLALLAAGLAYLLLCAFSKRRSWAWRGHTFALPSGRLAALQAAMGMANWLLLGTLLDVLMPANLDFASVMQVMLLAALAGVLTHVPAGIGVLEAVFVALLAHRAPTHQLLAALLAYRLMYYLAPLVLALLLYLLSEIFLKKPGQQTP